MPLVACPFCHDLFDQKEASVCPLCGMTLADIKKVGLSPDALADEPLPPEPLFEPLSLTFRGRMRGPLVVVAALGFALFFLPWIRMTLPEIASLSGFDLSRRLGWSWAAGVAWGVLIPTVVTRRSIVQMRGARVAVAFLSAVPAVTVATLLMHPTRGAHGVHVHYTYDWPLYATLVLSVASVAMAIFFGGRADDIRVSEGTSAGQILH